jgi:heme-degrading monooxygenase HmoA
MIVRVLTIRVPIDRSVELHHRLRAQLDLLRTYDGLEYVKLARRVQGGSEEIVLFEEWRDLTALYAWIGPDPTVVRLIDGADSLLSDASVAHYEALDVGLPDPSGSASDEPVTTLTPPLADGQLYGG